MIVSDESRLLIFYESDGSTMVGTYRAPLQVDTAASGAIENDGWGWIVASGKHNIAASAQGVAKVNFGTTFANPPIGGVQVTLADAAKIVKSAASYALAVTDIGTSSFSLAHNYVGPGAGAQTVDVHWRSVGTFTL